MTPLAHQPSVCVIQVDDLMFLLSVGFKKTDEALLQESAAGSYLVFCLFFFSLAAPKINGRLVENKINEKTLVEFKSISKFVLETPKNMHIMGL